MTPAPCHSTAARRGGYVHASRAGAHPGAPRLSQNEQAWNRNYHSLQRFIDRSGRVPSRNGYVEGEKQLADWLGHVRKSMAKGSLTDQKLQAIKNLHPQLSRRFASAPAKDKWAAKLEQVEQFVEAHGNLPAHATDNQDERSLYQWIAGQVSAWNKNKLPYERRIAVQNAHPMIAHRITKHTDVMRKGAHRAWSHRFEQLRTFIQVHARLPRRSGGGTEESLAAWLIQQVRACRNGENSAERTKLLTELDPLVADRIEGKFDDSTWLNRLQEVSDFAALRGRLPGESTTDESSEKKLGYWVTRYAKSYRNQQLKPSRVHAAQQAHPLVARFVLGDDYQTTLEMVA